MTARIDFQSFAFSPSSKQMDSNANFTTAGGFDIVLISTNCCFLIAFTAVQIKQKMQYAKKKMSKQGRYTSKVKNIIDQSQ